MLFGHTDIYSMASLSGPAVRATMITLAPFSASCRPALRPMPLEPPVIRVVYTQSEIVERPSLKLGFLPFH